MVLASLHAFRRWRWYICVAPPLSVCCPLTMWPQRVFSTWWLTLSLKKAVIQVLYLLVKFATLLQRPCWHFWAWSTFFSDNLPNCVQLCLRSRMYWISFFTGPGSAIFLGHPSTNSVWSSAVIQQPQNRRQRFSWERPKWSKMSHQMSPKVPGEAGVKPILPWDTATLWNGLGGLQE